MIKIGYQGTIGAFSYIAAKDLYPNEILMNYKTFADVIKAVHSKEVDFGIIPLENSYAGRVSDVYNLFQNVKLFIVAEKLLKITHCIAGIESIEFSRITHIYSHEQALKQCERNIKTFFPNAKLIAKENTAIAANFVKEMNSPEHVAICSELAAEYSKLSILKSHMQDANDNCTLFIVIGRKQNDINITNNNEVLTSVLFEIQNVAGSLYNAIGCFARRSIDLIKLESYIPNVLTSESAKFFVTIRGNLQDSNLMDGLKEIQKYTKDIHIFGSYFRNRK